MSNENNNKNLTKEEKIDKLKKELDILSKGKVAGAGLSLLGPTILLSGHAADYLNRTPGPKPPSGTAKKLKITGGVVTPIGLGLVAYSSYKKKKLKKELEDYEGTEKDDDKKD